MIQKQLDDITTLAAAHRDMKRRLALFRADHVGIGSVIEQPPEALPNARLALDVPVTEEEVERRVSPIAGEVEIRARAQQELERLLMKVLCRVKDGLAVGRVRAG